MQLTGNYAIGFGFHAGRAVNEAPEFTVSARLIGGHQSVSLYRGPRLPFDEFLDVIRTGLDLDSKETRPTTLTLLIGHATAYLNNIYGLETTKLSRTRRRQADYFKERYVAYFSMQLFDAIARVNSVSQVDEWLVELSQMEYDPELGCVDWYLNSWKRIKGFGYPCSKSNSIP